MTTPYRVPPIGAVMLDSLTLQSALRILGEEGAVQAPEASKFRRDKWDYDLNFTLRVAIDIECLAQLVHAIVFHSEIDISPGFMNDYPSKMRSGYGSFASSVHRGALDEVVVPLEFPEDLCREAFLNSSERAVKISRLPEFRHYLKALSSEGLSGLVLDISNRYFETGYSDASALPSFELAERNKDGEIYVDFAIQIRKLQDRALKFTRAVVDRVAQLDREVERLVQLDKEIRSNNPDHVLIELATLSDGAERMTTAPDLIRNTAAGLYFQDMAQLVNVPYMPHALRTPLVAFDSDSYAAVDLERAVVRHLQALRRSRVEAITAITGDLGFDLEVPLVLAKILQSARGPDEVLPRALELRETRSARRLRAWFTDLHAQLRTPDMDMKSVQRELEGFRALANRWADADVSSSDLGLTMGINLGMVNFSSPLPIRVGKAPRRGRLQFLYDLSRAGDTTPRLGPVLASALGEPIAEAWRQAQGTIDRFNRMNHASANHKSFLDLR